MANRKFIRFQYIRVQKAHVHVFSPVISYRVTIFLVRPPKNASRGSRGATRPCRMSQLVMRFNVLSLPPRVVCHDSYACPRYSVFFVKGVERNFLSYSCPVCTLQSKLCRRRSSDVHVISSDVRHQSFAFTYINHFYEIT